MALSYSGTIQTAGASLGGYGGMPWYADPALTSPTYYNPQYIVAGPITTGEIKMGRRLVCVYIVDPDQNIPAEDAVLFQSEPRVTDLGDQDLFYEIDIAGILKKHNTARTKIRRKGTEQFLEAITATKLSMRVHTLISF